MKAKLPITLRRGQYILRKRYEGKERETRFGPDKKIATTKAIRFLATAETSGYEVALAELEGRPVIKAGADPTFEEMKTLYLDFVASSAVPPRQNTIKVNLGRLRLFMRKGGWTRISQIDAGKLPKVWFKNPTPTPSQKRTFASAVASAAGVFRKDALKHYRDEKKVLLENPFKDTQVVKAKVQQYVPVAESIREAIWNDCDKELEPFDAMVVLLALGAGLRRSEACAATPSWFIKHADNVHIHVKEEPHFQPKEEEAGFVPITTELYERLLKLRGNSTNPRFVPNANDNLKANRLNKRYDVINNWLRSKGMTGRKPLHNQRKECGTLIARVTGDILQAAKILRNTPEVAMRTYTGVAKTATVDMGASFKKEDPLEAAAKILGVTVEELCLGVRKNLSADPFPIEKAKKDP
jgi:integrase